eukprot:TRINITY_DN19230_c0_g1_i2.p1 TRINITY_DN19230_c0_g1~~TRINITY_DN19230_c0_g1_i2.p1  ORF type:complete len:376 (+),score=75.89 TRINITY_DN19230_c0_g1_i2:117-1244(+)
MRSSPPPPGSRPPLQRRPPRCSAAAVLSAATSCGLLCIVALRAATSPEYAAPAVLAAHGGAAALSAGGAGLRPAAASRSAAGPVAQADSEQQAAAAVAGDATAGPARPGGPQPSEWVAVVGASQGIGRAVAQALCSRGVGVALTARTEAKAAVAAAGLQGRCARRHAAFDLAWPPGDSRAGAARDALGPRLDGLVISAALNMGAPYNASKVRAMVDITYRGQVRAYRALGGLLRRPGGHALFVLSNYAQLRKLAKRAPMRKLLAPETGPDAKAVEQTAASYEARADRDCAAAIKRDGYPYAVAKNLAAAFVRAEARVEKGELRVNGVHPGSVRTAMNPGGQLDPEVAGEDVVSALLSSPKDETGVMYHRRARMPW